MTREEKFLFELQKFQWHLTKAKYILNQMNLCPLVAVARESNNLKFLTAGRLLGFSAQETTVIAKAASNITDTKSGIYWREQLIHYCNLSETS